MRVAALAFGILAGLVASLILALGGLDVAADLGATDERQAQAIRFGLFVIGNLGFFGAALVLAAPLTGAIFLVLGAIAWVGAALLMHHSTDLVLITPPALLLIAAIFGVIAHFRRPAPADDDDSDVEIIAPARGDRARPSEDDDEDEEVGIPAFAATEAKSEPGIRSAFNDDPLRTQGDEWNPRRRQPPPPRAKPAFRPIEEEYEEDEPSGFSRFALGMSSVLSFGLYAALAGAAVLIVWNLRNEPEPPAVTVAEVPTASSAVIERDLSSTPKEARLSSSEPTLEPILAGEPIREVETSPTAPSASPNELAASTPAAPAPGTFGSVTMPSGQITVPQLADDFLSEDEAEPLPEISAAPPALPPAESSEPLVAEAEPPELATPPVEPTIPARGQPWPVSMPAAIAVQRMAPGTGPTTVVVSRPANSNNTGL